MNNVYILSAGYRKLRVKLWVAWMGLSRRMPLQSGALAPRGVARNGAAEAAPLQNEIKTDFFRKL